MSKKECLNSNELRLSKLRKNEATKVQLLEQKTNF